MKVDSVKTECTLVKMLLSFLGDMANASTAVSKTPFNEARLRLERRKSLPLPTKTEQGTYMVIEADLDYKGMWQMECMSFWTHVYSI